MFINIQYIPAQSFKINARDCERCLYRKIPKISPQTRNAINPPLSRPSKYKPHGGLYLEIALKYMYKVKQSKDGKFPSNYKASPIDFETQISLHR